jgi:Ca2+-transporting ATPase
LLEYGPNELATEPPPSTWAIAREQLANPMNIMLIIVAIASFAIEQVATGIIVSFLVTFNVVMGTTQEKKARASVEALAQLQVPHARVRRADQVSVVAAASLVPGDVVLIEAGDLVPADGRVLTSATLEVQEAALTGESAPVPKDAVTVAGPDTALGDRINMVFQNTQVTRGSASFVVTATGQATQIGHIADMVTATKRSRSPLQKELDSLTKAFGVLAWLAVMVIAVFGIIRGQDLETLALLCVSTAISAIPTGLPTFVQTILGSGVVIGAAVDAVGHDLRHQRRRGAVPHDAAVLQTLRRRDRRHRDHRRRQRTRRHAAAAPQAGHTDLQRSTDRPVADQRVARRG